MHFPVYLRLFGLKLHPHLFFESLSYTVGFLVFRLLKRSRGDTLAAGTRWSMIAAAAVGAVVGSKVLYWLEDPRLILAHWQDFAVVWGGKTIVGGLIGGLIAVEWVKRRIGVKERTGDLFAIPICVGMAFGRIGCFLTGLGDDTYGAPTSLPWGVNFGDGIPRHPTQLYDIVFVLLLACALLLVMRRPFLQGDVFKMCMVAYFGWRLLIDFLKPDPKFFGLNSIQWACVAVLVFYSRDVARWLSSPQRSTATSAAQGHS